MEIVTETKTEFRLRQWTKIIQESQASNQTIKAGCSQHNIGIKSYYYWLRKIRLTYCQSIENQTPAVKEEIVPLQFNPQPYSGINHPAVTIHLGTASIDIAEGTSQATIEVVLRPLQSVC